MSSQYGGGYQVQWRMPSTVEGYLAVQWGAIMKYSGGGGVRWRAIISTVEGASTVEGYLAVQWRTIIQYGGGSEVQWRTIPEYSGGCIVLRSDLVISLTKVCCLENLISFLKDSFEAPVSRNTLSGVIQWEFIKILRF